MKKSVLLFLTLVLTSFFSSSLLSQSGSTANTNSGANIVQALTLSKTADLHFGTMSIPTAALNVVLSTTNTRSTSSPADITFWAQAPVSTNAAYTVAGSANATYTIILPANGIITIMSGANSMHVNSFTCSYTGLTGTLDGSGTDHFVVGATLELDEAQPFGIYSGSFDATVAYN